jgi:hypothetical protein
MYILTRNMTPKVIYINVHGRTIVNKTKIPSCSSAVEYMSKVMSICTMDNENDLQPPVTIRMSSHKHIC